MQIHGKGPQEYWMLHFTQKQVEVDVSKFDYQLSLAWYQTHLDRFILSSDTNGILVTTSCMNKISEVANNFAYSTRIM